VSARRCSALRDTASARSSPSATSLNVRAARSAASSAPVRGSLWCSSPRARRRSPSASSAG